MEFYEKKMPGIRHLDREGYLRKDTIDSSMCPNATIRRIGVVVLLVSAGTLATAQVDSGWRRIGNGAIELALPSAATGPVDRVWYSPDGESLYARTHSGRTFSTSDFETWKPVQDATVVPPQDGDPAV